MNNDSDKWDKRFLQLAQLVSTWSKDPSTKVGSVIVDKDHRVVSMGFNGFAKGIKDDERLEDRDQKYKLVIHAEENALLHARQNLDGCTLYCYPFIPCSSCASKIIQSGIKRVVATDNIPERWKDSFWLSSDIFKEAGVEVLMYSQHDNMFGKIGYMCSVAFEYELGKDYHGTTIYPSVESYNKHDKHDGCNHVKVRTFLDE